MSTNIDNKTLKTANEPLKKDKKNPNALIIFIKTRIPNYYKINYEPYMTVPKSKSHTIFFDPLVKYYSSPIMNITGSTIPDNVFTQFFESNQFDTMINRILSDFRYMQKPLTLDESTNSGVIDNNIDITLNALFKSNNLFYINKHPYTIVKSQWNKHDWKIDTKPIEDLISPYELSNENVLKEAENELDDIPEYLRQGNASAANLNTTNALETGLGLKTDTGLKSIQPIQPINPSVSIDTRVPFISDKKLLDKMPRSYKNLYSKFLQKNTPINYSDNPDLSSDPFTLSLLINVTELSNYLKDQPNENITKLYNGYIDFKKQLNTNNELFINICAEIGIFKQTLNTLLNESYDNITLIKNQQQQSTDSSVIKGGIKYQNINNIIKQITIQKQQYISLLFKLTETIISMHTLQHKYFTCLQLLLIEIKTEFELIGTSNNPNNIIQYFTKPLLDIKCVDSDIATLSYLITVDPNNKYSESYFSNIRNAEHFYNTVLTPNKHQLLNADINYLEEQRKYLTDPSILLIEKYQYSAYFIKIMLYHSFNEQNIWTILYNSVLEFSHQVGLYGNELLKNTQTVINSYDATYSEQEQQKLLDGVDGMRAIFNSIKKQYKWFLVDVDGKQKTITDKTKIQEQEYINNNSLQIQSYDTVMLYTYLLEIQCLRHNKLFISEQNTNEFNIQYTIQMEMYYKQIKSSIELLNDTVYIPPSIIWDTNDYTNITTITKNMDIIKKTNIVYKHRIQINKQEIIKLNDDCESIYDTLFETMSASGFISQCNKIIALNLNPIPEYKTRSTYWLNLQIENFDIKNTNDLFVSFNTIIENAYIDKINVTKSGNPQDFIVYDNEGQGDCLFASIKDALNGQLDAMDADTDNIYTEIFDKKRRFTVQSLRKLVSDNYTEQDFEYHCAILGGVNNNGVCAFNVDNKETQNDNRDIYDLFVNSDKTIRTFEQVKEYISHPCSHKGYNYWGDGTTIKILQQILKIKCIIFDMSPRQNKKKIVLGDMVKQKHTKTNNIYRVSKMLPNNEYELIDKNRKFVTKLNNNPITKNNIKLSDNIFSNFRIDCSIPLDDTENMDDYIFLLKTKLSSGAYHYEFVRDASSINYIYNFDEIPYYITYFIYDCCYRFLNIESRETTGFGNIPRFQSVFKQLDNNYIAAASNEEVIKEDDFPNVNAEEIDKLTAEIDTKKREVDKIVSQNFVLSDEYNRISLEYPSYDYPPDIETQINNILTARTTNDAIKQQLLKDIVDKNIQLEELKVELNVTGGANNQYNPNSQYQYPNNQYYKNYNNRPYYQVPAGYKGYHYPIRPYNKYQSNKHSKLAYYISIELELFPGTSVNALQKTQVHCQSNFERIRESWSELWGYQYRPAALTEAYNYNSKMNKQKDDKQKEGISKQKHGGKTIKNKTNKTSKNNKTIKNKTNKTSKNNTFIK